MEFCFYLEKNCSGQNRSSRTDSAGPGMLSPIQLLRHVNALLTSACKQISSQVPVCLHVHLLYRRLKDLCKHAIQDDLKKLQFNKGIGIESQKTMQTS